MKFFYFSIVALLFSGCFFAYDPPQKGIEVFNNTESIVYVAYSFSDSLINEYPLVLFTESNLYNNRVHWQSPCYRLNAYSFGCIGIPGRETLLQRCHNNTLRLFFITESTMREKSWKEICEFQMYEKKITITEEELKKNDWVAIYD